jgi:hypothetical protein
MPGDSKSIQKIIENNSSLRVDFGWSFESAYHYETVMDDCIRAVVHKYNDKVGMMISDMRCSWLGFVPFNVFDRHVYEDMSIYSLILFNNEVIDFQKDVINFVSNHPIYREHAILRDTAYRFSYFKEIRKNPVALSAAYAYYLSAIGNVSAIKPVPRSILEGDIGCHFLYNPDLFFELLDFSILNGDIC